jgi:hypothetical protein
MRHLLVSVLLFAIAGAAFAQKGNQPARAADLEALSAVVTDLATRVSRLEGSVTPATTAGTYSLVGLEVEVGRGCAGCNPDITHHGTQTGSMVLNGDMTFTISGNTQAANIRLELVGGGTPNAHLEGRTTLGGGPFDATGTWTVSGKVITLFPAGEQPKTLFVAGPNLLVSAMRSDDGMDHSMLLAVRQ